MTECNSSMIFYISTILILTMETFDIIETFDTVESAETFDSANNEVLTLIRFKDARQIIIDALDKYPDPAYKNKQFQDIMQALIKDGQPSKAQNIDPEHLMYIEQEVLKLLRLFNL